MAVITDCTLLSIRQPDGDETLGIRTEDGVVDLKRLGFTLNLDQVLSQGRGGELAALANSKAALIPEATITYGRLFANPGKIVCVGLNYRRHAQEIGLPPPKQPVLFSKFNNSLAANRCTVKLPEMSSKVDYETELLIVIGRTARNVSEASALDYVAGYCTANDLSARDLQMETGGQWLAGKTCDGFAPIGPYFISSDQIKDPNDLKIQTWVNGEIRQDWTTSDFIFNCQQVISYISKIFPLDPGDLIFTGTPHGVIAGMPKDKQVWLKSGDKIKSHIEKLGTLEFNLA